ncbi:13397_t:CDS:1, partial [Ambispora gerdemannii]
TCSRCNKKQETQLHIWSCSSSQPLLQDIITEFIDKLSTKLIKQTKKEKIITDIDNTQHSTQVKAFCKSAHFLSTDFNNSANLQLNITHLIYGFVPDNLITFIKKFQFNQKTATSIAHKLTYWFALQVKIKIWNARCTTQINADKHNNILKKHKINTTNRSGRPVNSSSHYTSLYKKFSNPFLCDCEFLPEEHINGNCPPAFTPILYSNTNIINIIKLKTLSNNLVDNLSFV